MTPDIEIALVVVALIAYAAFREWLRHKRRTLMHQERLAAIDKGIDLPSLDQESKRSTWNVQRTLLFAGLIWTSLGVGVFATLSAVIASPSNAAYEIPAGIQWIGLLPMGIGGAHLIVYGLGKKQERRSDDEKR